MKIYTEINYKWLDGQLVETDSKSFEYEGKLSLCGAAMGGGGGGALPTLIEDIVLDPVGTVQDSITSVTGEDPVGSAQDQLENTIDENTDSLNDLESGINTSIGDAGDAAEQRYDENTDSFQNIEAGINTSIADGADGIAGNTAILAHAVNQPLNWLNQKRDEIGDFVHGSSSPSDVTIDPDKFAVDSSKKKKSKSDLAVNKSKKRARKSLRIG